MRLFRRHVLVLGLIPWFAGCLSPTLPLPPPARPDISPPDSSGITTVRGRVPDGTTAMIENLANGKLSGTATGDDGLYTLQVPAEVDDQIAVYYLDGLVRSQSIIILVPDGSADGGAGGEGGAP